MATKGSCYSGQVGERSIAISLYVCLCVSLSASIFLDPLDPSSRFFVHIPRGRGSGLLWRRCHIGFMDDVTFGLSGPYGKLAMSGRLDF